MGSRTIRLHYTFGQQAIKHVFMFSNSQPPRHPFNQLRFLRMSVLQFGIRRTVSGAFLKDYRLNKVIYFNNLY